MSYCAPEANAWVSARNWNRAFQVMLDLDARMKAPARRRLAQSGARMGFAVGVVGAARRADLARGGAGRRRSRPGVGRGLAAAAARVRRGRRAAGETGATLVGSTESPAGEGAFVGPVPAGAASVELVRDGVVLDRVTRSAAPRVTLLAPKRGARVGKRLAVRWRGERRGRRRPATPTSPTRPTAAPGGPCSTARTAAARRSPATCSARSTRGRLRVTVDDGFAEGARALRRLHRDGRDGERADRARRPGDRGRADAARRPGVRRPPAPAARPRADVVRRQAAAGHGRAAHRAPARGPA